ncbi:unnamed protein product [Rotaria sordida]|uniref:Repressor of the inhibitor of the protein kinase n=2 Tax=Rotaria sordida TaxID=392033 RepID=A0A819L2E7_9BILA|nr:unnamed protein product [Rotaria sordida]CAF1429240.1 unnamed protein product [Rotaria sordida]CAF3954322.1 unnamed protein product [Rotaria sordida]
MNEITKYFFQQAGKPNKQLQREIDLNETSELNTPLSSLVPVSSPPSFDTSTSSTTILKIHNDIGQYIGQQITDDMKYELLTNHFEPGDKFQWPYSERYTTKNGKKINEKRYLNKSHLDKHRWLKYSLCKKGLFCVPCALFSTSIIKLGNAGKLVKAPLGDYRKLLGEDGLLTLHSKTSYHENCLHKAENFIYIYNKKPETSIEIQLNNQLRKQIIENRERLKPIIQTIILCGKQNIALRGHRDNGNFVFDEESIVKHGNFRALLQYRVDGGDNILENHLKTSDKNATYISKTIQNQLIQVIGGMIIRQIIEEVKEAKFYTILLDETADISNVEQASLCLRYVYNDVIQEKFVKFITVSDRSGAGLAKLIMEEVTNLGLDLQNCVGQGYDGCSTMAGHIRGCQAIIKEKYPRILYIHCASHSFNLTISDSCDIRTVQHAIGVIKETYNFFRISSVRTQLFNKYVQQLNYKKKELQDFINSNKPIDQHIELRMLKTKLSNVCITRWVERHYSIETFYSLYPAVVDALNELGDYKEQETSTKAHLLMNSISTSDFLCTLPILNKMLSFTLNVSRNFDINAQSSLQNSGIDLMHCMEAIEDVTQVLQMIRNSPDVEYEYLFEEALELAKHTDTTIQKPRTTTRQLYRNNIPATTDSEYYKLNIFIPLLDHFLMSIKDRFQAHVKQALAISCIIPKYIHDKTFDNIVPAIQLYQCLLPGTLTDVKTEFILWKQKWIQICNQNKIVTASLTTNASTTKRKTISIPETAIDTFNECNEAFYPNIKTLLKIYSTLPVTTASNERTFSVLKLIKTYLRSTMSETRLNGLALLYIYKDMPINVDEVLNEFSRNKHRLEFAI